MSSNIETEIDQKTKPEKVSSEIDFRGQNGAKMRSKIKEKSVRKRGREKEGEKEGKKIVPGGYYTLRGTKEGSITGPRGSLGDYRWKQQRQPTSSLSNTPLGRWPGEFN